MPGDHHPLQIQRVTLRQLRQVVVPRSHIFQRAWKAAARIAHTPILERPRGDAILLQRRTEMPAVLQSVDGLPPSTVQENHHRRAFFTLQRRNPQIAELQLARAIMHPMIGRRRCSLQQSIRHFGYFPSAGRGGLRGLFRQRHDHLARPGVVQLLARLVFNRVGVVRQPLHMALQRVILALQNLRLPLQFVSIGAPLAVFRQAVSARRRRDTRSQGSANAPPPRSQSAFAGRTSGSRSGRPGPSSRPHRPLPCLCA